MAKMKVSMWACQGSISEAEAINRVKIILEKTRIERLADGTTRLPVGGTLNGREEKYQWAGPYCTIVRWWL